MYLSRFVEIYCDMRSMIDEPATVAVNVGVQMPESSEQRALGLGVARVEFP
jgi:hypothetical protein